MKFEEVLDFHFSKVRYKDLPSLRDSVRELRTDLMCAALDHSSGCLAEASRLLNVNRTTFIMWFESAKSTDKYLDINRIWETRKKHEKRYGVHRSGTLRR